MSLEAEIQDKLGTKTLSKQRGSCSGCINVAHVYKCDGEKYIFVKENAKELSSIMFEGELESLKAIYESSTVRVPKPEFTVLNYSGTKSALVMEYIASMKGLSTFQGQLGEKLAQLHVANETLGKRLEKAKTWIGKGRDETESYVAQFGFHCTTSCGYHPLNNEWLEDWISFYGRHRLEEKIKSIQEEEQDRQLNELWSELQLKLPRFFKDLEKPIVPALLHGDLWSGNASETSTEPVVYDPASFYGHAEFDLSAAAMFGGFNKEFYKSYHSVLKKAKNHDARSDLYQLFHNLNHWHHFGGGYKSQSLTLMRKLCKL